MPRDISARALVDQLETESELLLAGDIGAVLEAQEYKRALIDDMSEGPADRVIRSAVRTAAQRQQRLLRAALAGLNTARSHLIGASMPAPMTTYSANGAIRAPGPGSNVTLKKV